MFQREEYSKNQKPRGGITLQGAMVAPSDEDSVTFTIHAANGEVYRLRGESEFLQWALIQQGKVTTFPIPQCNI